MVLIPSYSYLMRNSKSLTSIIVRNKYRILLPKKLLTSFHPSLSPQAPAGARGHQHGEGGGQERAGLRRRQGEERPGLPHLQHASRPQPPL